jgi:hypothetical protein
VVLECESDLRNRRGPNYSFILDAQLPECLSFDANQELHKEMENTNDKYMSSTAHWKWDGLQRTREESAPRGRPTV